MSATASIAAGVAAIEDVEHQERSREHNTRWLAWLTEEIGKLGLKVTPSVANFVLIHFPQTKGRTAKDADAFLTARGLILRQTTAYKLPNALRLSVGTEEANRLVVAALKEFLGTAVMATRHPLFNRLALIGVGLIGGSIARAARALGIVETIVATSRSQPTRQRIEQLGIVDQRRRHRRGRGCGRRPRDRLRAHWRLRRGGAGNRSASQARRRGIGCRVGQRRHHSRHGASHSRRRPFRSGPSGRRNRTFRTRRRLCRAVRQSLVHPHAA